VRALLRARPAVVKWYVGKNVAGTFSSKTGESLRRVPSYLVVSHSRYLYVAAYGIPGARRPLIAAWTTLGAARKPHWRLRKTAPGVTYKGTN